jgi:type IV fimbrial biogenesis protein FimT
MKSRALRRRECRGVTLVESMVVVLLLALCATVAVPTFATWRVRDQVDARARALLGTFAYARSEAIRRHTRITVCRIDAERRCLPSGAACPSGRADWSCGWAVMAGSDGAWRPLRIQAALDGIAVSSTLTSFAFTPPAGQTIGTLRNFEVAPRVSTPSMADASWRRCIRIAAGGRARISNGACGASS